MYRIKIGTNYKELTDLQLRKFYADLCNEKMQEFIGDGNEWGKWFFRYDEIDKTNISTIVEILKSENYKIKEV